MKKLLFLLFFIPVFAAAQKTTGGNYTYIAQRYEDFTRLFQALNIPAGDSAQHKAGQDMRAGALYYDTLGIDAGLKIWNGLAWVDIGSGGFFSPDQTSAGNTLHDANNFSLEVDNINALTFNTQNAITNAVNDILIDAVGRVYLEADDSIKLTSITGTLNIPNLIASSDTTTFKPMARGSDGRLRQLSYWPGGGGGGNLLFDSLGSAGISPVTERNDTLYSRRISVSGGSIDTTASGGLLITIPATGLSDGDKGDITVSSSGTVWEIDPATVGLTELSATGTPSSSTYLRGDNTWATVSAAPGGSTTQVQFNNAGAFGGSSAFIWDNTNNTVSIAGGSTAATALNISKTTSIAEIYMKLFPATGTGIMQFSDGASSGFLPTLTMQPDGTTQNNTNLIFRANDSGTPANAVFTARNLAGSGGLSTKPLFDFQNFTTSVFKLTAANNAELAGKIGVAGQTSPTAYIHMPAGTATANTAPLKFTSGTNLTTPENGAVEYDGTHLYVTIAGVRYQLDQQSGSGVTTMGAIGSTPNANGATITGSTLNLEPASATFGGIVTTGTQSFAGTKSFGLISATGISTSGYYGATETGSISTPGSGIGFFWAKTDGTPNYTNDDGLAVNLVGRKTGTTASAATITPTGDAMQNHYTVTALATNPTFDPPSGTAVDQNTLLIRITDNGTSRTLTWNAIYDEGADIALPTATVISETMYLSFVYNSATSKWQLIGKTGGF